MQALGIIAEYNPFHNGHLLHLQQTKKYCDLPIIAVMSGSIMQRGEPAFADKWLRARMAVTNGVDLIFELPTAFALRSAEFFAQGGVKMLQATGIVTHLSCGAENTEPDYTALAQQLTNPDTQAKLHQYIASGKSYAQACQLVLGNIPALACRPNNILALEYAKALRSTNIKQIVISRHGNTYNDATLTQLASASAIRKAYAQHRSWQQAVPASVAAMLEQNASYVGYNDTLLYSLLKYKLTVSSPAYIQGHTLCTEGLENLLKAACTTSSFAEAVSCCTNKRYPASRIRRLLFQLLLAKPRAYYTQSEPAYLRILAFNDTGRQLLSKMKQTATLPIITKLGKNPYHGQNTAFCQQLELDIAASDVVNLLRPQAQPQASDFRTSPSYIKNTP